MTGCVSGLRVRSGGCVLRMRKILRKLLKRAHRVYDAMNKAACSLSVFKEENVRTFLSVLSHDEGQVHAEHGAFLGVIVVLCIATLVFLGGTIHGYLSSP